MLTPHLIHNSFKKNIRLFNETDPHLSALAELHYQYSPNWWQHLDPKTPGIYILTGGRQVGKSTSCKLLIKHCLQKKIYTPEQILYLPCDEIFDAKEFSHIIRFFLDSLSNHETFLLIIDEVTFVKNWDRVIKAIADEGYFKKGLCLLTGSDTLILKEAAMSFPGRRGIADKTDFHLHPLTFQEYVHLRIPKQAKSKNLAELFDNYLQTGGYLRAINDLAQHGKILQSTFLTYEHWIRGDFLKRGKNEDYLLLILRALMTVGVSQISYSTLTQKIGVISKETCIDYCGLLERMDILFDLQAFDQNKKQGFPRKDRKFHFIDPFIAHTIYRWLHREGYLNSLDYHSALVEATVASHCHRFGKTYYFKGQGEVDVIWLLKNQIKAIEVKWSEHIKPNDLKTLKLFKNPIILGKSPTSGKIDDIPSMSVYQFLAKEKWCQA